MVRCGTQQGKLRHAINHTSRARLDKQIKQQNDHRHREHKQLRQGGD